MEWAKRIAERAKLGTPSALGMRTCTDAEVVLLKSELDKHACKYVHVTHIKGIKLPYQGIIRLN